MRCQYKFKVHGLIKPNTMIAFEIDDYRFEFTLENSALKELHLSFPIDGSELPAIEPTKAEGISLSIKMVHPRWSEVETIIRQIESSWSLWGLEWIDISGHDMTLIPENEVEKSKIDVFGFKLDRREWKVEEIEPVGFDLLARTIIHAVKEKKHDVVMSFFRRGTNDIKREEYIEAFYDYYFMLESYFGNGKTKNAAIEKQMQSSDSLITHISEILNDPRYEQGLPSELRARYRRDYSVSASEFITKIVKLRGFLHHHNTKRKDGWDPGKQSAYKLEAFMLQDICLKVAMGIINKPIFSDEMVSMYRELISKRKL